MKPVPWALIQSVGLAEIAHGLMKLESIVVAGTEPSEMMLVTLYAWADAGRHVIAATARRLSAVAVDETRRVIGASLRDEF